MLYTKVLMVEPLQRYLFKLLLDSNILEEQFKVVDCL